MLVLTDIKKGFSTDLHQVDKLILSSLHSNVPLIQDIGKYIVQGGGKRLRPLLVLVCADLCAYKGQQHLTMAAVIEFIHTATLLHDDVVDDSMLRRGNATANNKWGNEAAVLVGDFLYSRAFQMMVALTNPAVLSIIADATNTIAEGEVMQLLHKRNPATTEKDYLNVIRCKTAKLFEAAAEVGAALAATPKHIQTSIAQYGLHLGTAYQLIDDLLDYQAEEADFGKQLGVDLAEGKPTMPLIYLLQRGTQAQRELIQGSLTDPANADLPMIQRVIATSGAMEYTLQFAKREANLARQALAELPNSPQLSTALSLADFVVERTH